MRRYNASNQHRTSFTRNRNIYSLRWSTHSSNIREHNSLIHSCPSSPSLSLVKILLIHLHDYLLNILKTIQGKSARKSSSSLPRSSSSLWTIVVTESESYERTTNSSLKPRIRSFTNDPLLLSTHTICRSNSSTSWPSKCLPVSYPMLETLRALLGDPEIEIKWNTTEAQESNLVRSESGWHLYTSKTKKKQ